jgi:protein-tyrosine-phosphatase
MPAESPDKIYPDKIYNVLFVCPGNASRSIMGEAILNRSGRGRFQAFSAGPAPRSEINPHAITLLRQMHHDLHGLHPKSWDEFTLAKNLDAPHLDFVFTVCDELPPGEHPPWPGQPLTADWGMPDPDAVKGSEAEIGVAFADTYRMLNNRITLLMNLPMTALDRLTLQEHLDAMGDAP